MSKPLNNYNYKRADGHAVGRYYKTDGGQRPTGEYVDLFYDLAEDSYVLMYYDEHDTKLGEEYIREHSLQYAEDACENWALGIKQVDFGHKL